MSKFSGSGLGGNIVLVTWMSIASPEVNPPALAPWATSARPPLESGICKDAPRLKDIMDSSEELPRDIWGPDDGSSEAREVPMTLGERAEVAGVWESPLRSSDMGTGDSRRVLSERFSYTSSEVSDGVDMADGVDGLVGAAVRVAYAWTAAAPHCWNHQCYVSPSVQLPGASGSTVGLVG
ncbi:hypothetical protein V7S43_000003 [Phytophthora oleae]|uniref:Uncharacterized protein n=1 Tax=Phytophthora oleae TaxID=2107226 RepID=A0ABD3G818_9STRA